ncbi:MAG TPA: hypothetical protein DDY72_00850 [Verrucomicrobia bacterium]|nr:hypothetical protein [Verrucomicrobiota bacterium]
MKTLQILCAFVAATACAASAADKPAPLVWTDESKSRMAVSADKLAADRQTGAFAATGNVRVVSWPFELISDNVTRDEKGLLTFSDPSNITSCTNDWDHLHWRVYGEFKYATEDYVFIRNLRLRLFNVPVFWLPLWYYPLNTDYGWRVMPGYTSRWGAYVMTKYVYKLAGSFEEGAWGLGGNTRFDLRKENGVGLGQTLDWQLGPFGRGKFKVYYALDNDYDRIKRHWSDSQRWNYQNWGSTVERDRYALSISHRWEPTERDTVRVNAAYLSDSYIQEDFLKTQMFGIKNDLTLMNSSEMAWEHIETLLSFGVSVSGPLNDFYSGVSRLPEAYFDMNPTSVFGLPLNYESSSRIGWLDRQAAKIGSATTALPFRYNPGPWADYQALRVDTYHRFTLPFKVADILSVVPRVAYRGTFWNAAGMYCSPETRTPRTDDNVYRSIIEGGVTLSLRGRADFGDWTHTVEPYVDILVQDASYSGLSEGARPLKFDAYDGSFDWLDQFDGRSRSLPYSWYGVTPGIRNVFYKRGEDGYRRPVLDLDLYCRIQFNDTDWTSDDLTKCFPVNPEDPNYGGKGDTVYVPGLRARWMPVKDAQFGACAEWNGESDTIAYAAVSLKHRLSDKFNWEFAYSRRDNRWWDYSASSTSGTLEDRFNWTKLSYMQLSLEHDVCDLFAWGPYISYDCDMKEVDRIGAWFDLRTDCLGFRIYAEHQTGYTRVDGSKYLADNRFGFFIYLRALGPTMATPLGE